MTQFQVHCSLASLHFAGNELGEPMAICFPENYLGEKYKKVLAFWFRLDSFTKEQWDTVIQRRQNINPDWKYWEKCDRDLIERDDEEYDDDDNYNSEAYLSAFKVYYVERESAAATLEIILGVESPVFLPLFEGLLAPPETEALIEEFLSSN